MLIEIDGRRYPVKRIEDLELRHIAQLQFELGSGQFDGITSLRTIDDIERAMGEWGSMPKAERSRHVDGIFLTCFTVWAARNLAGETLTLMEAISVPAASLRIIAEPEDLKGETWENYPGGEGGGKAQRRPGGSRGGARRGKPKRKHR